MVGAGGLGVARRGHAPRPASGPLELPGRAHVLDHVARGSRRDRAPAASRSPRGSSRSPARGGACPRSPGRRPGRTGTKAISESLPVACLTRSARSMIAIALRRADVEDLARDLARVHQPGERAHGVGDVAERARLRPVAVHLERLAGQRPLDEARDHHPVLAALPRADGVEQARRSPRRARARGGTRARGARPSPSSRRTASASRSSARRCGGRPRSSGRSSRWSP